MSTKYPTAVHALLTRDVDELRLVITTNTGRELEDWAILASELDAAARAQIDTHLSRAGLRYGAFQGDARAGWRATVQSSSIDPDAASD